MPPERQIYLLDPQSLPPETIAVTFAKTSRSAQSFREIAAELTDEKSAEFHEKWVVGYGHSSVAEHAVLHVAVENISRLAVESLESNRLASYTEKSTRYQTWKVDDFYIPGELEGSELKELYQQTCHALFSAYQESLGPVRQVIAQIDPPRPDESESKWDRRVRSQYIDVCRFYLPAAALANVGMTINARALEHCISKMLSHPLDEVRAMGEEIKRVSQAEVPTLVKYANKIANLEQAQTYLAALKCVDENAPEDWCKLVHYERDSDDQILAAALYRTHNIDYTQAMAAVGGMSPAERQAIADLLLGSLSKHDIPLRELEHSSYTFDLILDQGAYFELKRHRMMTQTAQPLTTRLGYAMPSKLVKAGLEDHFKAAMQTAADAYERLAEVNPDMAAYVVPNACNRRVLLTMNLRSAYHLVNLRAADNAHFSIRRAACRIADEIQQATPLFGRFLIPPSGETCAQIDADYFTAVK